MFKTISFSRLALILSSGFLLAHTALAHETGLPAPQAAFFNQLQALCGARYEGEMTFPTEGQDSFAGKLLVAELVECNEHEVRIPFAVGENRSRTWIVKPDGHGLQLKHDHRHADGTPDEVTNYGGTAQQPGTALAQAFPADEFTAALIPEAATNEWNLIFSEDFSTLTYHLTRHDKARFTAVLQRVSPSD